MTTTRITNTITDTFLLFTTQWLTQHRKSCLLSRVRVFTNIATERWGRSELRFAAYKICSSYLVSPLAISLFLCLDTLLISKKSSSVRILWTLGIRDQVSFLHVMGWNIGRIARGTAKRWEKPQGRENGGGGEGGVQRHRKNGGHQPLNMRIFYVRPFLF